jgi:hypothetical protein
MVLNFGIELPSVMLDPGIIDPKLSINYGGRMTLRSLNNIGDVNRPQ